MVKMKRLYSISSQLFHQLSVRFKRYSVQLWETVDKHTTLAVKSSQLLAPYIPALVNVQSHE